MPNPLTAIQLSIIAGLWCAALGLVPAMAVGWILARRDFRGKTLVSTVLFTPIVAPPVVTGFILLSLFGREGYFGAILAHLGVSVTFSLVGVVLAAFTVGFPLYVMSARAAFEAVDPRLEEVSWTLGVTPLRTFWRVTLPLSIPGIAAGGILTFARALGEFGATVVLAGNIEGRTRTISLAVYTLLESPHGLGTARVLVACSIGLSLAALAAYESLSRWSRRRLETWDGH